MMNFNEFQEVVLANIKSHLPAEYREATLEIVTNTKLNDTERVGLTVRTTNVIAAIHYLEPYFKEYLNSCDLDLVLADLARSITEHYVEPARLDLSWVTKWDQVKDKIEARLINAEKNSKYLENVVSIVVGDLATIFVVMLDEEHVITVTNRLAEIWNCDADALLDQGLKNQNDLIVEYVPDIMWIVTNRRGSYGAACILKEDVVRRLYDTVGGDFFVLPSSVHELIVIPSNVDKDDVRRLVQEVNMTEVEADEVLSDNVYKYENGMLVIA